MHGLTEKQKLINDFINKYQLENGYPPTYRDIANCFSMSVKGAYDHVMAINKKGFDTKIKKIPSKSHCISNGENKTSTRAKTLELKYSGILIPKPCMICGCLEVQAHHISYSDPLKVLWFCKEHHRHWHYLLKISNETIEAFKKYYASIQC